MATSETRLVEQLPPPQPGIGGVRPNVSRSRGGAAERRAGAEAADCAQEPELRRVARSFYLAVEAGLLDPRKFERVVNLALDCLPAVPTDAAGQAQATFVALARSYFRPFAPPTIESEARTS